MAKINSINNFTQDLTIDPGASGDSYIQFAINGTNEFRIGVDDTDGDAFKISQGGALGTTDTFIATAAGEITKPLQPAFLAVLASTQSNVTGDGTNYVINGTEIFDQSGDLSSGVFTAPVDGVYKFSVTIRYGDFTTSFTDDLSNITTSNITYRNIAHPGRVGITGSIASQVFGFYFYMDAADTADARAIVRSSTKTVDVLGNASIGYTWWYGYLCC